ncbi:MAG: Gfo/Idh/MocA family oxidoreductase [Planctomycetes bacterium]|nr:Gfo/Idh/MocA family oxidoreductase [Planctomycetota bacterium]
MNDSLLQVGVVGYGYWGPNLVRNFMSLDGISVKAVSDLDKKRLKIMSQSYPGISFSTDYMDIINDPAIDAVIVATPVSSHYPIAKAALLKGKHCFVEKPLADSSEKALELIEIADAKGVHLFVDYTFLFTGAVKKMKELVDQGALGDLLYFDSVRINLGLFQHDINVIWDLAPHDLSIMDYLINRPAKAVSAIGACHVGNGLENVAYVSVIYDDNLVAHFHCNWLAPVKMRQIILGGNEKMVIYDEMAAEKIKIYDRGVSRPMDQLSELPSTKAFNYRMGDMVAPKLDETEALKSECSYILNCIQNGSKPINDGEAGLRIVKILEAATQSVKLNGTAVELA